MKVEELGWKFACKIWTDKESASRDCVQIARHDVPCHGKLWNTGKKKKEDTLFALLSRFCEWRESNLQQFSLQIFFFFIERKKSDNE